MVNLVTLQRAHPRSLVTIHGCFTHPPLVSKSAAHLIEMCLQIESDQEQPDSDLFGRSIWIGSLSRKWG